MATPDNATDDRLLAAVRQVLEGLKKTTDGAVLYSFIERGLRKFGDTRIETAFLAFVDKLLQRYLDGPDSEKYVASIYQKETLLIDRLKLKDLMKS